MDQQGNTSIHLFPPHIRDNITEPTVGGEALVGLSQAQGILYVIMTLVGAIGNILVLLVVSLSRSLQNATSTFVVMLAASDLMVCCTILPISTYCLFRNLPKWPMPPVLCQVTGVAYVVFRWSSILAIMLISIDRCIAIRKPLRYKKLVTIKRACVLIVLALIVVISLALLPLFGLGHFQYSPGKALCAPEYELSPIYTLILLVGASCLPIVVTLIMYTSVAIVALKTARKGKIVCDENNCTYVPPSKKAEFKAVKPLVILTGAFMSCWLPYIGANLWQLGPGYHQEHLAESLTELLALLSSVINPWMYSLLNKSFKLAYSNLKLKVTAIILGEASGDGSQGPRTISTNDKVNDLTTTVTTRSLSDPQALVASDNNEGKHVAMNNGYLLSENSQGGYGDEEEQEQTQEQMEGSENVIGLESYSQPSSTNHQQTFDSDMGQVTRIAHM